MIVVIGEILIDCFPNYERTGGAPFNFAFHLKQLGWPVRLLTRIGADANGDRILDMLQHTGFRREDIQIDPRHATGIVDVSLDRQGVPQFAIRADAAYDYIDLSSVDDIDFSALRLIYFGSLAQRTDHGFLQVQRFLEAAGPAARRFCDINLRPPHIHSLAIQSCLRHADILKLNRDELFHISTLHQGPGDEAEALAWLMQNHEIHTTVLTMGSQGSKVITGNEIIASPPATNTAVIDTVGAGDAYAAVFAAGYLKGLPVQHTLELATGFAAHVCGLPGAIPPDDRPYRHLRHILEP